MTQSTAARRIRWAMLVLNVVGLGVATYLTYIHYAGINPLCTAGEACIKVQTSLWSKLAGVPVALIGLIGYVSILISQLLPDREETRMATLGMVLIGFGFSAYLTYRELFSIHAICEWCASSAVIMTLLLICSAIRFVIVPAGGFPPADPPATAEAEAEAGRAAAAVAAGR